MKTKQILSLLLILVLLLTLNTLVVSGRTTNKTLTSLAISKDGLWQYGINNDTNRCGLFAYYGKDKTIELPKTIDGKKINYLKGIDNNVVENITIPSNYTSFMFDSFRELESLKTVTFSREYNENNKITRFDGRLFYMCPKLEKVILPNEVGRDKTFYNQYLGRDISGGVLGASMFEGCENLKEVIFPDDLVEIQGEAFLDCSSIEKIIIPEGVSFIGSGVFEGTTSLKTLVLPDSLERITDLTTLENTTIICNPNSYANKKIEEYNTNNGTSIQTYSSIDTDVDGDVNRDNAFNVKDVTATQKYLVRLLDIECVNSNMLDYDKNGKINILDATAMQKALAKI